MILVLALVVNAYRNRGLTVFSEIYRDIFCFRGETKVLTIGGSVNSDQVPLVLLEDGWDVLIIVCGMTSQLLEGLCELARFSPL